MAKVIEGVNDLATLRPDLLEFWCYEKNNELGIFPNKVGLGSHKKVYWICSKCKIPYEQIISKRVQKDSVCGVCKNKIIVAGRNDVATTNPEVLKQWDWGKNSKEGIFPTNYASGSPKKVWWVCENGHSYLREIGRQVAGDSGCPECQKSKGTSYSEQYLYICFSEIFEKVYNRYKINNIEVDIFIEDLNIGIEYDGFYAHTQRGHQKNKDKKKRENLISMGVNYISIRELKPRSKPYGFIEKTIYGYDYSHNSKNKSNVIILNKIINLIIQDINKQYFKNYIFKVPIFEVMNDKINSNLKKYDYEKSLAYKHHELLKYWDYEKNIVKPEQVYAGSDKYVWWRCEEGHSYYSSVANRVSGYACPYCSNQKVLEGYNDMATTRPDMLKIWDYEKNTVKPTEITAASGKKYWWVCEHGHSWEATANHISKGRGCPYCANKRVWRGFNDLASQNPELAAEFDIEKNGITPNKVLYGGYIEYWWRCEKEHCFKLSIRDRVLKSGKISSCPICKK